jgi:uncharacterized protein
VQVDFLRGVALLGILVVNMGFFLHPFGKAMDPMWLEDASPAGRAAWSIVSALFAYKFISLFSMLFGFGVALQMAHVAAARRNAWGFALRRFGVLAVFGAAHGVLVWYGDILFVYACLGLVLTAMRGLAARTLLIVAASIAAVLVALAALGAVATVAGEAWGGAVWTQAGVEAPAAAPDVAASGDGTSADDAPPRDAPNGALAGDALPPDAPPAGAPAAVPPGGVRGFDAMIQGSFMPASPQWMAGETAAYREGPWEDEMLFRGVTWGMCVALAFLSYGWHALCMMLLGMWAFKVGLWRPERQALRRRIAWISLGAGLPLTLASVGILWLAGFEGTGAWAGYQFLHSLTALVLPAGYAMAIGGAALLLPSIVVRVIAGAGRMALTVYLCESLLATSISYWWGLGLFGGVSGMQSLGLALGIWVVLVAASAAWLRVFRMGPMEWLWRVCTYGTLHPGAVTSRAGPPAP